MGYLLISAQGKNFFARLRRTHLQPAIHTYSCSRSPQCTLINHGRARGRAAAELSHASSYPASAPPLSRLVCRAAASTNTRTFHTSPLLHTTSSLAVVHSLPVHRYRSVELHGEARRAHVGQLLHGLGASESASVARRARVDLHLRLARWPASRGVGRSELLLTALTRRAPTKRVGKGL